MQLKTILFTLLLLFFGMQPLNAKTANTDFLLRPDDTTSFMNYEFHTLALEAAKNKEYEEAFRIYQKVAKKSDDKAEYNIGMMYMKGLGVKKSKMDAYKWLRRASKHGNKEATLFFKQMNERYEKNRLEKEAQKKADTVTKKEKSDRNKTEEKNSTTLALKKVVKPADKELPVPSETKADGDNGSLYYTIAALIGLIIVSLLFFLRRSSSSKSKEKEAPKSSIKLKAHMFESTYANISNYHTELLKYFEIDRYKNDKKKMQMYYMFLAGMIDYFCQLENFNEMEERRIFTTHMASVEGKENVTAITQAILEGQRETSLYHAQAAGGISAKEWHETGSTNAFTMLKKVLTQKRG